MCPEESCEENSGRGCLQGALVFMPLTYQHTQRFSSCTQGGWDQKTEELAELWLHLFSHHQLVARAQAKVSAVLCPRKKKTSLARDVLRNLQGTVPAGNTVLVWEPALFCQYSGKLTERNAPFPRIPYILNTAHQTVCPPGDTKVQVLSVPSSASLHSRKNAKRIQPESPDSCRSCRHSWSGHW